MEPQIFDVYLKQTQQIAQRLSSDPSALLDLMQLIETQRKFVDRDVQDWDEFFKGEASFYSGQYEKSLQHYLTAKGVPHYHFFCFRTSCFVARARGNPEQAINFAKKALKLNPNDGVLKQFLHDLNTSHALKTTEQIPKISLGEKEIAELASIFEEPSEQHEELFSQEVESPKGFGKQPLTSHTKESSLAQSSEEKFKREYVKDISLITPERDVETVEEKISATLAYSGVDKAPEQKTEEALFTLKQLAKTLPEDAVKQESLVPASELESRIGSFQAKQEERFKEYLDRAERRHRLMDNGLFILNGWNKNLTTETTSLSMNSQNLVLSEQTRKSSGGIFFRWGGKGVVINPGVNFLDNFHSEGFLLQDIHAVIVTTDSPSDYADIKSIYELNNKLNKQGQDLQIIHYYLNPKAYQELTSVLKPSFKQARHTVHNLELFLDSPDVEKTEICEGIQLHYFLASPQENPYKQRSSKSPSQRTTLGIRFELSDKLSSSAPTRLCYVSGAGWSPILGHHLDPCDILITAFGNTSPGDYTKNIYQEDSLGFHGTYSLLEEIAPRLLIATEFGGREGDIRIEAIKKLRQDILACGRKAPQESTILPGDVGLDIDLKTLKIQCSITGNFIDPELTRVAKSNDSFGRLLYLSPSCYL